MDQNQAPKPEVQHLITIFRRIRLGEIRIPVFQRGFTWTEAQVLSLLDSVYRGFPISSLLFWRVEADIMKVQKQGVVPFPNVEPRYPVLFVLDGMQRLSTLYGVLNYNPEMGELFDISFDLSDRVFRCTRDQNAARSHVRLGHLFTPKEFLADQQSLLSLPNGEALVEDAIKLHTIFQEYLVPLVTIERSPVEDVVEIFERINTTGTSLGPVDFMRALTWSPDFDLSDEIASVQQELADAGYEFDDEVIMKVIAVMLDRAPTASQMLSLRRCPVPELKAGVRSSRETMRRVVEFLDKAFGIKSTDFIPYEGQVLVLAALFRIRYDDLAFKFAKGWYISSGLNELLRGRPDNFVARLINEVQAFARGEGDEPSLEVFQAGDGLVERRIIKGAALSTTAAILYGAANARSIYSGEVIRPEDYLAGFNPKYFEPITDMRAGRGPSIRTIANTILLAPEDITLVARQSVRDAILTLEERLGAERAREVAQSQFMSEKSREELVKGNDYDFLWDRSKGFLDIADALLQ